jgi:hypothetical protein
MPTVNLVLRPRGVSAPNRRKPEGAVSSVMVASSLARHAGLQALLGLQLQPQAMVGQALTVFDHGAGASTLQCEHHGLRVLKIFR